MEYQPQEGFDRATDALQERPDRSTATQSAPMIPASIESNDSTVGDAASRTEGLEDRMERDVKELARKYTRTSTYSNAQGNPFDFAPGSILDPDSNNFNPKAWTKALLKLYHESGTFVGRSAGIVFRDLTAYGHGSGTDYQESVGNIVLRAFGMAASLISSGPKRIDILRSFDGLVNAGEMLIVLGPPGSGCSTFLKSIAGDTHGFQLEQESYINYQGVSYKQMHSDFRGEAIYTAEQDVHFPLMTVGDTLYFAARSRAPRNVPGGLTRHQYAKHMRDVIMATFGIKHTMNSKVGNDYIRGVSGGERKRVSIAEAALSRAPLQCWDNSTRGLDSANAIEFCKTLRTETEVSDVTAAVAIYQAPQAAYDLFDKATVLYEGHQIYFGPASQAKQYFVNIGFECPEGQTDADFLTSMTSPDERILRPGFHNRVPRTSNDFATVWKNSVEYQSLKQSMAEFDRLHPIGGDGLEKFENSRASQQAKNQRLSSPYTLSYTQQIRLCLWRGFVRLRADPSLFWTQLIGNAIMALITGSVFYNLNETTDSFFARGALLFFVVIMNAFGSALEILLLYDQRPIVEKHDRYALYHPSAEAFASILTDIPYKILNTITFNTPIYFMTNLRREPGPFFFFLLISFITTLVMSKIFRTIASMSRTMHQALAPAAVILLAIIIYTGFVIPVNYMLGWSRWINYINPVAYAFESIMANEFSSRDFPCTPYSLIPPYGELSNRICAVVGSMPAQTSVSGDVYIGLAFSFYAANKWRNVGILFAFIVGLGVAYLVAAEFVAPKKSKGEVLVFPRGQAPALVVHQNSNDIEAVGGNSVKVHKQSSTVAAVIQKQTAVFQWHNVTYDINIKSETRRILDHVDGWVKPGSLTALMGVSGAGKTTLLDVLASRVTMGVIGGEMLVDGHQRNDSFQRKTGYVQQQDLHMSTSTVREALNFSAILRQPSTTSRQEKLDYVTEVIKILEMEEYADAVIGYPGEGLNVEQRKRLTIGVELAAKPQLLLFLDEPTSGLDSQTSWSIISLLEKLTKNGQAVLCTIHQPSSMLFRRFDRLLLLAAGGKTVYFGDIGESSKTLISYFERNGAGPCPSGVNPAEWMLSVIGAAAGTHSDIDWSQQWRKSPEMKVVHMELENMKRERSALVTTSDNGDASLFREFAASFWTQFYEVQKRLFQQYWRNPTYIYSKLLLCVAGSLFIGLSFLNAKNTIQGLQNQMFGIFMLMTLFGQFCEQIMPHFVTQRALYEVRERPSKAYSWQTFMISQILVEIPWDFICAIAIHVCWYYPIGLLKNAEPTNATHERGALMFLLILTFLVFTSTFAHMTIASIDTAETAGTIANTVYVLVLVFCGVLASPVSLPGFWIFMYRVSPFTYLIDGMLSTAISGAAVVCADNEYLHFSPPSGQTCGIYMSEMISQRGGYLLDVNATAECTYCRIDNTNQFLASVASNPDNAWRNFGLMWVFIAFNCFAAVGLYWAFRVPKEKDKSEKPKKVSGDDEKSR